MKTCVLLLLMFVVPLLAAPVMAQKSKPVYQPCLLADSAAARLAFIQTYAYRIFNDTAECKQILLDSIGSLYNNTADKKYLTALETIHERAAKGVEGLYTDLIKRFCEKDFAGFGRALFAAGGGYRHLEDELIETMNMIVGSQQYKQKYIGQLNVQVLLAKEKNDSRAQAFWEKLKQRIETDQ